LIILALGLIDSAFSWGTLGHNIVADLATQYLTTKAAANVKNYIPAGATLVSISTVADTYRSTNGGQWSAPLHYVDMDRGQTSVDLSRNCAQGCVVSAIQNYTARLNGSNPETELPKLTSKGPFRVPVEMIGVIFPDIAEPTSVEFLVHFVGDIHQPCHTGWLDDQGGNLVKVNWYTTSTNLHSVWDTSIITKYNSNYLTWSKELQNMIAANTTMRDSFTRVTSPLAWANEGFSQIRLGGVYKFTGNPPTLGDAYYNANLPAVKLNLIAAGLRLATLLNRLLG